MIRLLLWVVGGLVLGGIIHIVTVLGLPRFAPEPAYQRIGAVAIDGEFSMLARATPGVMPLPLLDPAMEHAVCRFNLSKGPIRIRADMPDLYWSIGLYDAAGLNVYSLSDRAADQKPIDILVANSEQIAQIRETPPDNFDNVIILDWGSNEGFAIIRALAQTPGASTVIADAIKSASCAPFALAQ
jgi:uncharacterized membrane protein